MKCAEWQERIALDPGGEDEARHLAECAGCRVLCLGLRDLREEEIDAAAFTAVRARVIAELGHSRAAWWRLGWIAGAAAVAIVALVLGWPRKEAAIPDPPRMMAVIPSAPIVAAAPRRTPAVVVRVKREKHEPLMVQLQTSDPNIVIYWIAD